MMLWLLLLKLAHILICNYYTAATAGIKDFWQHGGFLFFAYLRLEPYLRAS